MAVLPITDVRTDENTRVITLSAASVANNDTSSVFLIAPWSVGQVQVYGTTLDADDLVTLQVSNNGTNWETFHAFDGDPDFIAAPEGWRYGRFLISEVGGIANLTAVITYSKVV